MRSTAPLLLHSLGFQPDPLPPAVSSRTTQLSSRAGRVAVTSRNTVMPARSAAATCSALMLLLAQHNVEGPTPSKVARLMTAVPQHVFVRATRLFEGVA